MSVPESEPSARIQWRPLGELLVESGVITRDELDTALAEQAGTGKLLGEILVALGAVSGPALTVALAEQWGVDVAPESGFGTGLWHEIERRHRLRRTNGSAEAPRPRLKVVSAPDNVPEETLVAASLAAAEERLREYEQRIAELEAALADQERASALSQPELAHVCFFQDADRYALVEAAGPPPPVGTQQELESGGHYTVWKIGRSPLPQDARICAFLIPVS